MLELRLQQAYRLLEEQIVTLRLRPGQFLSEYALADSLEIGRTPIREALQRLAAGHEASTLPQQMSAFGINGSGVRQLFASHPPIEERIARLQAAA